MSEQEVKYGELENWDEANVSGTNDFMNLKEGENDVRIFTKPFQFQVAWIKDASGAQRKLRSASKNCPLVKKGYKVTSRWYLGVLDRKSGLPKILEISSQIFLGIKTLYSNEKWGDVTKYDINVNRNPKGANPLYNVIPYPKSPLTDEEKAIIARFKERVDIGKFTQPPTPEEVEVKLSEILGISSTKPHREEGSVTVKPPANVQPAVTEEDFDFGDED